MIPTDVLAIFYFSLLVSFGAVVSPGPVSAAILSEAPRKGWRVGPLIALGHTSLELILVVLISLGLAVIMKAPTIRIIISAVGGLVLLWIGAGYALAGWKNRMHLPNPDQHIAPRSSLSLIGLGMLTTLSNPFWYTWWVTVAAGYLAQAQAISVAAVGAFYVGHISADFAWDTALATATGAGQRWLSQRAYRALILITGGFMIYLGVVYCAHALDSL